MFERLFFPGAALVALALIGLALVWPQGIGARSPAPFGHTPYYQSPEMKAAIKRRDEAAIRRAEQARRAVEQPAPAQ